MAGLRFGKEKVGSLEELREVCAAPEKAHEYLQELFAAYREARLDFFLRNSGAVEEADKINALNSEEPNFPAQFREALGLRNPLEEVVTAFRPSKQEAAPSPPQRGRRRRSKTRTPAQKQKKEPQRPTPSPKKAVSKLGVVIGAALIVVAGLFAGITQPVFFAAVPVIAFIVGKICKSAKTGLLSFVFGLLGLIFVLWTM